MKISARTLAAVSGLLDQVLELPVPEREPWLQELGKTQPEMEPVLREMLAAREQSDFARVLEAVPRIGGDATATVATSALHEGERVGPYLLKRELGIGGMAVVWLAQRADGAFKRDVALKLLDAVAPAPGPCGSVRAGAGHPSKSGASKHRPPLRRGCSRRRFALPSDGIRGRPADHDLVRQPSL